MKKYLLLFSIFVACGHSQSQLSDSRDVASSSEERSVTQEIQPVLNPPAPLPPGVKTLALQEYEAATARPRFGFLYRTPLTSSWQETFRDGLGLSQTETLELYRSSIFSPIFVLDDSEEESWFEFLPPLWIDSWFQTRCIFCKSKKSVSLGNAKQFLTDEKTGPNLLGMGSSPATAYDPRTRRYVIVWDERAGSGVADVFARLVDENGTPVAGMERKKMSVERPSQGCLSAGFRERTGISAPTDCRENVEPAVAYHNGRFLITWTKRGKAIAPAGAKFSVIIGRMVNADNLEPIDNWQEGILLSKVSFYSADPNQGAGNDSEVVSWRQNEHSALAPFLGGTGQAQAAFLLVWETNKNYAGCTAAELRTSTSIYGRVISPNFNPQGSNPDIFPIYKDPSTAQVECAPNADVDSARKPRVAYLSSTRQFLTVFEVSKNISESLPSIGGNLVTLGDDLSSSVGNMYRFEPLDSQIHEGCFDPDVVSGSDHFMLVDNIGHARLKLTKITVDRGSFNIQNSPPYVAPEGKLAQRARITLNRVMGEEGGSAPHPLEYIVAYEWRPTGVGSLDSKIQVVSFSEQLNPQDPRPTLAGEGFPTNIHPALASGGEKILVAWNALKNRESQILDSVVTVNQGVRENQKPVAAIDMRRQEGGPVIEGEPVILESGSSVIASGERSFDPENRLDAFRWRQTEGRNGTFENASGVTTNFTAPTVLSTEELTIELRVIDQEGLSSDPVTKRIRVVPPAQRNNPPRARISQRIDEVDGEPTTAFEVPESKRDPVIDPRERSAEWPQTRITLSAAKSDDGEDPPHSNNLGFHWDRVDANGSDRVLPPLGVDGTTVSFEVPNVSWAEQRKTIVIRLTVTEVGGITDTEDLTITVTAVNHRPTAPVLTRPVFGYRFSPRHAVFEWGASEDPDVNTDGDRLVYDVLIGEENPPVTPAAACIRIVGPTRCVVNDLEPNTPFSWRVQVRDVSNEVHPSQMSSVGRFDTLEEGIVFWFPFDEGAGNQVHDGSGNNIDGVFHGSQLWVEGVAFGAVGLDGDEDYVVTERAQTLGFGNVWTISFWVFLERLTLETFFTVGNKNGPDAWKSYFEGVSNAVGGIHFNYYGDDGVVFQFGTSETVFTTGSWHHVVVTNQGIPDLTTFSIFIDGVSRPLTRIGSRTVVTLQGDRSRFVSIGRELDAVRYVRGNIDDFIIYNRVLTQGEIAAHFCNVRRLQSTGTQDLPPLCR